ncbi:MAG: flagellar M-ring protein FliF [Alphaproteobacteria bacterium]|nr:flagellar M-ring protein FliF [Alphaproteobacteria bacterium]
MGDLLDNLRRLGPVKVALLGGVVLGMIAFFFFVSTRLTAPPMSLLFGQLSPDDANQIAAKLDSEGVPYELRSGGTQIWVPEDRALKLRMSLAESGGVHNGSVGYELFDKGESIGATNFVQNLNLVRALEGELERTIASLSPIAAARVHLVMPRRDLFSREKQEPTASVVIKMREAGRLTRGQIQAIQNLVAGAVPGMKPTRVSLIDDKGTLLARGSSDDNDPQTTAENNAEQSRNFEQRLGQNVEQLLERAVGPGKVRVDVHADLNFDRIVTNTESFDPDGQVVRSTQSVTENSDSSEANQNNTVTVANNLPGADQNAGNGQNNARSTRSEETVNYEITKTTRSHVQEIGSVKRLSVAVIVDGTTKANPDGTRAYTPRPADEMQRLTAIVRSAIGFDEKRGDTLEVVNVPFAVADIGEEIPTDKSFLNLGLAKQDYFRMAEILVLGIVAILVIMLVARPMIRHIFTPPEVRQIEVEAAKARAQAEAQAMAPALAAPEIDPLLGVPRQNQVTADDLIDLARVEGRVKASSMKKIGEIVEKHPDEAVAILRTWMYQEG